MATAVNTGGQEALSLEVLATRLVSYLDLDTVVSLAHTNRTLHAKIWNNESVWKDALLSEFLFVPSQKKEFEEMRYADPIQAEDGAEWLPSCTWRRMALSLNNVVKGRYRMVKLDEAGTYEHDSDDASFSSVHSSVLSDNDADDDLTTGQYEDDSMMSFVDDEPSAPAPEIVEIDGVPVSTIPRPRVQRFVKNCSDPHRWWAETLYRYHADSRRELSSTPWDDGDPTCSSRDGYLAAVLLSDDLNEDLVVFDLCASDEALHHLGRHGLFQHGVGLNLLVGNGIVVAPKHLYFNLAGPLQSIALEGEKCGEGYDCSSLYRNYWLRMHRGMVHIHYFDRVHYLVETIYSSRTVLPTIQAATQDALDIPEGAILWINTQHDQEQWKEEDGEEEDEYRIHISDIAVVGRLLLLATNKKGVNCIFVIDMKTDTVVYGIHCFSDRHDKVKFDNGLFRGVLLSCRKDWYVGDLVNSFGILFAPEMPALDVTHARLLQLFAFLEDEEGELQLPIRPHPSKRLPLHEIIGAENKRVCDTSEQLLLVRMCLSGSKLDLRRTPLTRLVCMSPLGTLTQGGCLLHELCRRKPAFEPRA